MLFQVILEHSQERCHLQKKDVGMGLFVQCLYALSLHLVSVVFCHCHPYIPVHFWKIFYLLVYIWVLSMLLSDLLQLTTSHTRIIKLIIVISTVCGKFPSLFIQSAFKSGINPELISIFCHKQGITMQRETAAGTLHMERGLHA